LARQRRVRAEDSAKLKAGARVVRTKFGVDDEICTGDHSCIRLSGCPSLTVKPSPDPLRTDPVASVIESCVGCGLCGEVAHAAVLCPSFYRAELIQNASAWDRLLHRVRRTVIGWLTPREVRRECAAFYTADRRARRRGRRRAHRLDRVGGGSLRPAGAVDVHSRRRAAHRRHDLLHRDLSGAARKLGGRRPVLALSPGVGDVDMVVASELLEAGRAISSGFVTTDRTLLLASTSRVYLTVEKMQMADGRYDCERLMKAAGQNAKEHLLFDMEAAARQAGAIVNSVMLGAIAGIGAPADPGGGVRGRDQGRTAKAVESNLRGFRAGLAAARDQLPCRWRARPSARQADAGRSRSGGRRAPEARAVRHRRRAPSRGLPEPRLRASLSQRLKPIAEADARANAAASCSARPRAISRCACRSRMSSRRRGEDRAGALPPHRGRDRREGSALRHHGIPQARHRGSCARCSPPVSRARSWRIPKSAAGSERSISAWS
jgi:Pyruvate/2-oxoacid:ferredoxin oxidoreductase gamma subunit/NAD-dependent dihydropyrimidine dehydrogenase PreA subunit